MVLDIENVCSDAHEGEAGCDAGKKTKCRKPFIGVATLAMLLGGLRICWRCPEPTEFTHPGCPRFEQSGSCGSTMAAPVQTFAGWFRNQTTGLEFEVIKRIDDVHGFKVSPKS